MKRFLTANAQLKGGKNTYSLTSNGMRHIAKACFLATLLFVLLVFSVAYAANDYNNTVYINNFIKTSLIVIMRMPQ